MYKGPFFLLLIVFFVVLAQTGCGLITRFPFAEDPSQPQQTSQPLSGHRLPPNLGENPSQPQQPTQPVPAHLSLPPNQYIHPGATITGRVMVDQTPQRKSDPQAMTALFQGAVVEAGKQRVPVNKDGLFVFKLAEDAQSVWVRVPQLSSDRGFYWLPQISHEVVVTPAGEIQTVAPGTSGPILCEAPPTAQAGPPYIVTGKLPGGGNGLATEAQFGRQAAPLLWKTDSAAAFDTKGLQTGPQMFSLREDGNVVAVGSVQGVRLTATSNKETLKRGEVADFQVKVEGLPGKWLAQKEAEARAAGKSGEASAVAFLNYRNYTPNVGHVEGKPIEFSIPMLYENVRAADTPAGSVPLDRIYSITSDRTHSVLYIEIGDARQQQVVVLDADLPRTPPTTTNPGQLPHTLSPGYSFTDTQRYRGDNPGSFNVQVTLRLPDTATKARRIATIEWSKEGPPLYTPSATNEVINEAVIKVWNPPLPAPTPKLTVSPCAPGETCCYCTPEPREPTNAPTGSDQPRKPGNTEPGSVTGSDQPPKPAVSFGLPLPPPPGSPGENSAGPPNPWGPSSGRHDLQFSHRISPAVSRRLSRAPSPVSTAGATAAATTNPAQALARVPAATPVTTRAIAPAMARMIPTACRTAKASAVGAKNPFHRPNPQLHAPSVRPLRTRGCRPKSLHRPGLRTRGCRPKSLHRPGLRARGCRPKSLHRLGLRTPGCRLISRWNYQAWASSNHKKLKACPVWAS